MIDITVTTTKGVEAAEKNLQQAKNRLATVRQSNIICWTVFYLTITIRHGILTPAANSMAILLS
ncbi:hypothetical protein [Butyrivibrio sp. NC2007]|uniref:hypothetical protein n=1 Tax=Butyrivibrio sp. NC2007 TaxID=1280683 RepID=UPI0003B78159|nr:hypothetical protein [Butyrivibrio sp. NC2007]